VKCWAGFCASVLAASAGAQEAFGTKRDAVASMGNTSPAVGMMPFLQMMAALTIVFLMVKFLLPKIASKMNKKLVTGSGSQIKIEENANFAGGHLYVVSARGKTLLLSAGQGGVSCLADLSDSKPAREETPLFMDILDREQTSPSHLYVEDSGSPTPVMRGSMADAEIAAALERLDRLGA
jgi:hypothetical protein